MFVFYDHDGRISRWGSADTPYPGLAMVELSDQTLIDPTRHRIVDGHLADVEDLAAWNVPTETEMAGRIEAELAATDQYMMPDRKVPNRDEWIDYRKILRDLSKLGSVAAQLKAWPTRPDKR